MNCKNNWTLGLKVKNGIMQDMTCITLYLGHTPADKPRGGKAKIMRN